MIGFVLAALGLLGVVIGGLVAWFFNLTWHFITIGWLVGLAVGVAIAIWRRRP